MKQTEPRVFEYRIKYNVGSITSAMNNYHYYMACTADQALSFHDRMMQRRRATSQTISVEWRNPWNNTWEDKSDCIMRTNTQHENN